MQCHRRHPAQTMKTRIGKSVRPAKRTTTDMTGSIQGYRGSAGGHTKKHENQRVKPALSENLGTGENIRLLRDADGPIQT